MTAQTSGLFAICCTVACSFGAPLVVQQPPAQAPRVSGGDKSVTVGTNNGTINQYNITVPHPAKHVGEKKRVSAGNGSHGDKSTKPPTLAELFATDFQNVAKLSTALDIKVAQDGKVTPLQVRRQLYLDFPARTVFVGFYIPANANPMGDSTQQICLALSQPKIIENIIKYETEDVIVSEREHGQETTAKDLTFSGRVIFYHDAFLSIPQQADIIRAFAPQNIAVQFRGPDYLAESVVAWHRNHDKK